MINEAVHAKKGGSLPACSSGSANSKYLPLEMAVFQEGKLGQINQHAK